MTARLSLQDAARAGLARVARRCLAAIYPPLSSDEVDDLVRHCLQTMSLILLQPDVLPLLEMAFGTNEPVFRHESWAPWAPILTERILSRCARGHDISTPNHRVLAEKRNKFRNCLRRRVRRQNIASNRDAELKKRRRRPRFEDCTSVAFAGAVSLADLPPNNAVFPPTDAGKYPYVPPPAPAFPAAFPAAAFPAAVPPASAFPASVPPASAFPAAVPPAPVFVPTGPHISMFATLPLEVSQWHAVNQ